MHGKARHTRIGRGLLWFCLLGGAIAWTFHLLFAYGVAEFGCVGGLVDRNYLGVTLVAWLEIALTIVTTLVAGVATAVAFYLHRHLQKQVAAGDIDAAIERNTTWAGLLTSGTFTIVILFESIPILYYLRCC